MTEPAIPEGGVYEWYGDDIQLLAVVMRLDLGHDARPLRGGRAREVAGSA